MAVETLTPDPANLNKHGDKAREALTASLRRFGQRKPIVVDAGGVTIAGAGVLEAARSLGWTFLAAVRDTELSKLDRVLYAIADNRTGRLSEFDNAGLAAVLGTLDAASLSDAGFTAADLAKLIPAAPAEFPAVDSSIATEHECPKCHYRWSGAAAPAAA